MIKKWAGLAFALMLLAAAPLPADAAVMSGMVNMDGGGGSTYQLETDVELSDEQKQALEKIYEIIPALRELTEMSVSKNETADTWHVWLHEAQDAEEAVLFAAEADLIFAAGTGELSVVPGYVF